MVKKGLDIVRLNMSHGTHQEHLSRINLVREVEREVGLKIPILVDLCGPKIRIGKLPKEPIYLHKGQEVVLTTEPNADKSKIFVNYDRLHLEVKEGQVILLADGTFRLRVKKVVGRDIVCEVLVGGPLTSFKGVNLPHTKLSVPALTEKDKQDLKFAISNNVDAVALSFVRSAHDVILLRAYLKELKAEHVPIIAKIEKPEAVNNIDEIISVADGIMVARGDLGVEIPIEEVPIVQKKIIKKANLAGKPVITATQMLRSMVDFPLPTRAEVTDVANAVLDGTDALMLSEETAVGKYPVESVATMSKVSQEAEKVYPYQRYESIEPKSLQDSLAKSACSLAKSAKVKAILPFTRTGATAAAIAKFRPTVPVFAVTHDEPTCKWLSFFWGVSALMSIPAESTDAIIEASIEAVKAKGVAKPGDKVIVLAGAPTGVPGSTNLIKVVEV